MARSFTHTHQTLFRCAIARVTRPWKASAKGSEEEAATALSEPTLVPPATIKNQIKHFYSAMREFKNFRVHRKLSIEYNKRRCFLFDIYMQCTHFWFWRRALGGSRAALCCPGQQVGQKHRESGRSLPANRPLPTQRRERRAEKPLRQFRQIHQERMKWLKAKLWMCFGCHRHPKLRWLLIYQLPLWQMCRFLSDGPPCCCPEQTCPRWWISSWG